MKVPAGWWRRFILISLYRFWIVIPLTASFNLHTTTGWTTHLLSHSVLSMSSDSGIPKTFKVLGVCGGIGSGKSSASKLLVSEWKCLAHLDADSIAHSVYSPGSQAVRDIVDAFGKDILEDNNDKNKNNIESIDRKRLGAIVFSDRNAMAKLERLVWPHVKTLLLERIDVVKSEWQEKQNNEDIIPVVVLEAAVLLDAEWDDILDGIWAVTTPRKMAVQRLMDTRGLSREESEKRLDAQESRRGIGNLDEEVQKRVVTRVIDNRGSLEDLTKTLGLALRDPKSWR